MGFMGDLILKLIVVYFYKRENGRELLDDSDETLF
jgi:hypothetical protein